MPHALLLVWKCAPVPYFQMYKVPLLRHIIKVGRSRYSEPAKVCATDTAFPRYSGWYHLQKGLWGGGAFERYPLLMTPEHAPTYVPT